MKIALMSFGFKRGMMPEANMVFDVRFLKNPYYDPALQPLSGLDAAVGEHIESDLEFRDFYEKFIALVLLVLKRNAEKAREEMAIAIGCTGGRHRSVYMVQKLSAFLRESGYNVSVQHRDLENI